MHHASRWMHKCIRIPVGCVGASGLPDNADQCRFPDKGGGFFRSVVQNGPQIPYLFRSMGYSYNGYYSGLLIRQIRVRIPGSPLTPHRTNGSGRHILSVEIRVRLPLG